MTRIWDGGLSVDADGIATKTGLGPWVHMPTAEYDEIKAELSALRAENERLRESNADDIRALGWAAAVHNDYRQDGKSLTFWLFTKDGHAVKGEGPTDCDALNAVRHKVARLGNSKDG